MKKFTVVGRYEDNGQTYIEHVEASGPIEAADAILDTNPELDEVLAVFEGSRMDVLAPYLEVEQTYRRP